MTLQIYFWITVLITTTFQMTKELLLRILLCERRHISLKMTEDFLLLTVIRNFFIFFLSVQISSNWISFSAKLDLFGLGSHSKFPSVNSFSQMQDHSGTPNGSTNDLGTKVLYCQCGFCTKSVDFPYFLQKIAERTFPQFPQC